VGAGRIRPAFLQRLASFGRLITFDKRGTGLSDRLPGMPTLDERARDVGAVMGCGPIRLRGDRWLGRWSCPGAHGSSPNRRTLRTASPRWPNGRCGTRILIVDDHEISKAACRGLLRTEGLSVLADLRASERAIATARAARSPVLCDWAPGKSPRYPVIGRSRPYGPANARSDSASTPSVRRTVVAAAANCARCTA
jgi:hypothetical protein